MEDVILLSLPHDRDDLSSGDVVSDYVKRGSSTADKHHLQGLCSSQQVCLGMKYVD